MNEQALLPQILIRQGNTAPQNILIVVGGTLLIALLAQVSIPLWFTPVPITGQTFGVALVSLLYGRKRALTTLSLYFVSGAIGAPFFAGGQSGIEWGPTLGYLIGMILASFAVGTLADLGFTKSYWKAFSAAVLGSTLIFSMGLIGLSFFLPADKLLMAGLIPFLPGDIIKHSLAAGIATRIHKNAKK